MIAEVPETLDPVCGLFSASGYIQETLLTDYVWRQEAQGHEVARVDGTFVIPATVDDLAANGLLEGDQPQTCWGRSVETLTARKDDIRGLAVASDEGIEAYLLYIEDEIVALRTLVEDGRAHLKQLLSQLRAAGPGAFRIEKVHPAEIPHERLEALGFQRTGGHSLYEALARAD